MMETKMQKFVRTFNWVRNATIPFVTLNKPLSECRVALVTTGGVFLRAGKPFVIEGRSGFDESCREIPSDVDYAELDIIHEHFNHDYALQDMNVIFPLERLHELVEDNVIKEVAETSFSISGFIITPKKLFTTAKEMAAKMLAMAVDIAVIVPV
jgi:D-proline reductase (dithiol) PrdB